MSLQRKQNEQEKRERFHALDCEQKRNALFNALIPYDRAAFSSCAFLWCEEISPPSGAMD